jgi:alkanesulfonate monooxygenase SsuD/methylene tetrahydromethanopterin reductase-like flavin-dependent oxidoreductase (luciferase family)
LPGAHIHATSWHEPLITLAAAAGCTERIRLGTAVLVAGIRHPIWLAKQFASLANLTGPRVALGAASGWYSREYEVFGYSIKERRGRTDECLVAFRKLMTEDEVSFDGRYWSFKGVSVSPRPGWKVPIYIGGGTRLPEAGSEFDVSYMAESVLQRIATWDGWIAPCAGDEHSTYRDLESVNRMRARQGPSTNFKAVHVQWTHIVDSHDRDIALSEQIPAFRATLGENHSVEHLRSTYLVGSLEDIRERLTRLQRAGFHEVVLGPVKRSRGQIELIAELASSIGAATR